MANSTLTAFPDLESALMGFLTGVVAGATCGTATPSNLADALPFVRITRFGGNDDLITDTARVSIDAFTADWTSCQVLAEAIRQKMLNSRPIVLEDCVIDHVSTLTGPSEIAWGDVNVRRRNASYQVSARRS